jgi:hypothetical protein
MLRRDELNVQANGRYPFMVFYISFMAPFQDASLVGWFLGFQPQAEHWNPFGAQDRRARQRLSRRISQDLARPDYFAHCVFKKLRSQKADK